MSRKNNFVFIVMVFALIALSSLSYAKDLEVRNDTMTFLYINGSNGFVGVGTSSPDSSFDVHGVINTTGNIYEAGQRVCTALNGLCAGSSSVGGGWSNTSTTTSTGLNVNITTGNLTVTNGRIGIGTNSLNERLNVGGNIYLSSGSQSSPAVIGNNYYSNAGLKIQSGDSTVNVPSWITLRGNWNGTALQS